MEFGKFQLGPHTLAISTELHQINRKRLLERLRQDVAIPSGSVVLLQGGKTQNNYNTDTEPVFRQESYFHWTFGVREPDFYGAIDLATGNAYLFAPKLDESYAIWMGKLYTLQDYCKRYTVDGVFYTEQIGSVLRDTLNAKVLLTLKGMNTDSRLETIPALFPEMDKFNVNDTILHDHMAELRVYKTPMELEVIRYTNRISSEAHIEVMQCVRPGMAEYQLESLFRHYCYFHGGARHVSYTCICASGPNGAVLHYGHAAAPNDRILADGDMCTFDMGCEYYCYASDITCSFPVSGRFSEDQKIIYEAVLKANRAVLAAAKPGISWLDMHLLAERIQLEEMQRYGLLKGDVEQMMNARLGFIFMPHGMGHLLGIDVHDVGGYLESCPERSGQPGLKQLRTARLLAKDMVLTIEPGIYFVEAQLERARQDPQLSQFIVWDQMERFRTFGGIRIEDNVVITENGCELLTKVPRTVKEIETIMADGRKRRGNEIFPRQPEFRKSTADAAK